MHVVSNGGLWHNKLYQALTTRAIFVNRTNSELGLFCFFLSFHAILLTKIQNITTHIL